MKSIHLFLLFLSLITLNICSPRRKTAFLFNLNKAVLADNCKDLTFLPVKENVKIIGRYYQKNDITWVVQSGSAVEFYATGLSAQVIIAGGNSIYNDEKYRPRLGVYVDDEIVLDKIMDELEVTVDLFKGTTEKTAKIKVMLLSEANNGGVGVKSININSCSGTPIKPVEKKKLTIEIIGDSISAAYGVEGANQYENFKTSTENFSKSYAYLAAKKLDADYYTVVYSGHGIISGYSTGEKNSEALVPEVYTKISKNGEYPGEWDFENNKVDVILINLGTNDLNYVTKDPANRNEEFIQEYANFLTLIREKNPESYIVCTVGIMGGGDEIYPLIEKAVELVGDSKISSYKSQTQNMNDGLGSDWHPSLKTQTYNSYVVADKICNAIGIESDQVGLDVAADSKYDVSKNEANGANMSFWVGYDKSFNINTVFGGKVASDIEATCSGIGLKKGGVYTFEFEYTYSKDIELPILIRGKDKVHFKDSLKASSTKIKYSKEITIEDNDQDAEIVFQLGTLDSFQLTLNNIKLTKIK